MTFKKTTFGAATLAALLSTAAFADDHKLSAGGSDATAPEGTMSQPAVDDASNAGTDNVNEGMSEATTEFTFDAEQMMSADEGLAFLDQGRSSATWTTPEHMAAMDAETKMGVMSKSDVEAKWGEMEADAEAQAELRTQIEGNAMATAALEAEGYTADDVVGAYTNEDGAMVIVVDAS